MFYNIFEYDKTHLSGNTNIRYINTTNNKILSIKDLDYGIHFFYILSTERELTKEEKIVGKVLDNTPYSIEYINPVVVLEKPVTPKVIEQDGRVVLRVLKPASDGLFFHDLTLDLINSIEISKDGVYWDVYYEGKQLEHIFTEDLYVRVRMKSRYTEYTDLDGNIYKINPSISPYSEIVRTQSHVYKNFEYKIEQLDMDTFRLSWEDKHMDSYTIYVEDRKVATYAKSHQEAYISITKDEIKDVIKFTVETTKGLNKFKHVKMFDMVIRPNEENLHITTFVDGEDITLKWNAINDADFYEIYLLPSGSYIDYKRAVLIETTDKRIFKTKGKLNTINNYWIKALNYRGIGKFSFNDRYLGWKQGYWLSMSKKTIDYDKVSSISWESQYSTIIQIRCYGFLIDDCFSWNIEDYGWNQKEWKYDYRKTIKSCKFIKNVVYDDFSTGVELHNPYSSLVVYRSYDNNKLKRVKNIDSSIHKFKISETNSYYGLPKEKYFINFKFKQKIADNHYSTYSDTCVYKIPYPIKPNLRVRNLGIAHFDYTLYEMVWIDINNTEDKSYTIYKNNIFVTNLSHKTRKYIIPVMPGDILEVATNIGNESTLSDRFVEGITEEGTFGDWFSWNVDESGWYQARWRISEKNMPPFSWNIEDQGWHESKWKKVDYSDEIFSWNIKNKGWFNSYWAKDKFFSWNRDNYGWNKVFWKTEEKDG